MSNEEKQRNSLSCSLAVSLSLNFFSLSLNFFSLPLSQLFLSLSSLVSQLALVC